MYLLEGERRKGAEIHVVPSDDGIGVPTERLLAAIDERTRLVPISHTLFRSAFVQDAEAIARRCQEVGALLLLDVYQSAGALPLELEAWSVDAAVGGSVKWLCGGPGAGYLWVNPKIAETLEPTFTGWQADEEPFAFRPGAIHYSPPGSLALPHRHPQRPRPLRLPPRLPHRRLRGSPEDPRALARPHPAPHGSRRRRRLRAEDPEGSEAPRRHGDDLAPGGGAADAGADCPGDYL
jgi:hypothetical protein